MRTNNKQRVWTGIENKKNNNNKIIHTHTEYLWVNMKQYVFKKINQEWRKNCKEKPEAINCDANEMQWNRFMVASTQKKCCLIRSLVL